MKRNSESLARSGELRLQIGRSSGLSGPGDPATVLRVMEEHTSQDTVGRVDVPIAVGARDPPEAVVT